ncbi:hypothetical protein L1281_000844 [Neisseria sp. HSC-16F19]|nr:tetratricopeptide repeat protein [Neisseria sp. HSC-16F19]MCP2040262.1 hypothetical protein [Neisseria sp. HSC-16F19]
MELLKLEDRALLRGNRRAVFGTARGPVFVRLLFAAWQSGRELTLGDWQQADCSEGGAALRRNQIIRVLDDVEKVFAALDMDIRIGHPERKRSGGPWMLQMPLCHFVLDEAGQYLPKARESRLFANAPDLSADAWMHLFLESFRRLAAGDVAYARGQMDAALAAYRAMESEALSAEARGMVRLRQVRVLRVQGEFDAAAALVDDILADPALSPVSPVVGLAAFYRDWVAYGRDPQSNYLQLLTTALPPPPAYRSECVSMLGWHNLRALLLRRHLENGGNGAECIHREALAHLQEGVFLAMWQENLSKAVDLMMNLALHLQRAVQLGLSTRARVLECYHHTLSLARECGFGDHSEWSRIYLAEFYWQHYSEMGEAEQAALAALSDDPREERYYTGGLARLQHCGDVRQQMLLQLSYAEFARHSLLQAQQQAVLQAVRDFLHRHPWQRQALAEAGYAEALAALEMK